MLGFTIALLGSRLTGRRAIGYGLAILLYFVPQVTVAVRTSMVGYADFPLSIFYLATAGYLLCSVTGGPVHSYSVFAACLASLPWIKQEGAILWAVAALAGAAVTLIEGKSAKRLLALSPGLVLLLSWQIFLWAMATTRPSDF